jgi:hypothetical protein
MPKNIVEKKYRLPNGKIRITADLPTWIIEKLDAAKKESGISKNFMLEQALKNYFKSLEGK